MLSLLCDKGWFLVCICLCQINIFSSSSSSSSTRGIITRTILMIRNKHDIIIYCHEWTVKPLMIMMLRQEKYSMPLRIIFLNTLRPRQNGRHFADAIFKYIFLNEYVWIPIKISLKFLPKGRINNIPAMVQIMAWRLPGDKPLSKPMMVNLLTHICVTRPQWVKSFFLLYVIVIIFLWIRAKKHTSRSTSNNGRYFSNSLNWLWPSHGIWRQRSGSTVTRAWWRHQMETFSA